MAPSKTRHPRTPSTVPSRWFRRKYNRIRHGRISRNRNPFNAVHCKAKSGVCHILNIPLEIRNIIYSMVIDDLDSLRGDVRHGARLEQQGHQAFTIYQTRLPNINTTGLLRTNHQVREETIQAIKCNNATSGRGICYRLYIFNLGNFLSPIWSTRPAPPHFIQSVEVDLKMYSLELLEWTHAWDARVPGKTPQCLLQLLRRFICYGPRFKPRTAKSLRRAEVADALPLKALTIIITPL